MSKKFFLTLLSSLLILLVLSIGTGLWVYEQSKNNKSNKPALVGGSYSLLDHNGKEVTDKSFPNKFKIMGGTPLISLNSPSYNFIDTEVMKKETIHR